MQNGGEFELVISEKDRGAFGRAARFASIPVDPGDLVSGVGGRLYCEILGGEVLLAGTDGSCLHLARCPEGECPPAIPDRCRQGFPWFTYTRKTKSLIILRACGHRRDLNWREVLKLGAGHGRWPAREDFASAGFAHLGDARMDSGHIGNLLGELGQRDIYLGHAFLERFLLKSQQHV